MPTRRFELIALVQILVGGCAVAFGLIETCTSAAHVCASAYAAATAGLQSIKSRYRASTQLQTHNTFNTKHDTFNTKSRSKC